MQGRNVEQSSGSQSVDPRSAAVAASAGCLSKQNLRLRPTESQTPKVGLLISALTSLPGHSHTGDV